MIGRSTHRQRSAGQVLSDSSEKEAHEDICLQTTLLPPLHPFTLYNRDDPHRL